MKDRHRRDYVTLQFQPNDLVLQPVYRGSCVEVHAHCFGFPVHILLRILLQDLIYKYNVGGKWLTCRADAAAADAQVGTLQQHWFLANPARDRSSTGQHGVLPQLRAMQTRQGCHAAAAAVCPVF